MGGTQRRGPVEQRRDRLPGQSLVDETVGFGGHAKTLQRLQRQTHQLAREACSVMDERLRFVARLLDGEAMTEVCREFGAVDAGARPIGTPGSDGWTTARGHVSNNASGAAGGDLWLPGRRARKAPHRGSATGQEEPFPARRLSGRER